MGSGGGATGGAAGGTYLSGLDSSVQAWIGPSAFVRRSSHVCERICNVSTSSGTSYFCRRAHAAPFCSCSGQSPGCDARSSSAIEVGSSSKMSSKPCVAMHLRSSVRSICRHWMSSSLSYCRSKLSGIDAQRYDRYVSLRSAFSLSKSLVAATAGFAVKNASGSLAACTGSAGPRRSSVRQAPRPPISRAALGASGAGAGAGPGAIPEAAVAAASLLPPSSSSPSHAYSSSSPPTQLTMRAPCVAECLLTGYMANRFSSASFSARLAAFSASFAARRRAFSSFAASSRLCSSRRSACSSKAAAWASAAARAAASASARCRSSSSAARFISSWCRRS
mmetsp:Transcript_95088/g.268581  ORF Transcript_95088/g.268581 Transcript_95088/m.268581 type:complete len:336 (+) Transcript_95088:636-1643(+)